MTALENLANINRAVKIAEAKLSLWEFCKVMAPDFYKDHRTHLRDLCIALQALYQGTPQVNGRIYKKVMVNMPPQHGKTRTVALWCMWVFGQSTKERVTLASYGDSPAHDMSRNIRNGIQQEKNIETDIVYSDIFPETTLQYGDASVGRWALDGEHFNFLAAGIIGGAVTSKGATIQIFDDLIKGREQALSDDHKDKVYGSKSTTWGSRKDASVKEVLEVMIATLWADDDPCNRELANDPDDWFVLKMPALNEETGEMLCDDFLDYPQYMKKLRKSQENIIEESIFLANFQQETIDKKGLLYKPFKTYSADQLPAGTKKNWTDTADEGEDYLASVCYVEDFQGYCYVTDIYYTQERMEETEIDTADMLRRERVATTVVESNNGGKGFARAVEKLLVDVPWMDISWRRETGNKQSRILNNAATVNRMVLFPDGWKQKFPSFYKHITGFKKKFKANKHDDAADVLTKMVEDQHDEYLEVETN